ncbi:MAG: 16S rRNA (uracil(1498)-N(3))-methyltransferase [Sphingobacteriia bacterium]|nr:16S rRNA (uracil(1498)-N(3))-methyltransferase [Sphingobacteriia bacterium]NCC38367.1 16S rRNA (uracil(1498)-N(3))-methyltransferase [Gammaproteobacteria bacterium]
MATRTPRVYVETRLSTGEEVCLPPAPTRHLIQVLRLVPPAHVILFNGDGHDYHGHLVGSARAGARVALEYATDPEPMRMLDIHLAIGISRGERMDYAVQKAVELGVGQITPLFTERTQVQLTGERLQRRRDHWRGVVIGACEQAGRRRLPRLHEAMRLTSWLDSHHGLGLLLDPKADRPLTSLPTPGTAVTLMVGAEGGLSPRERGLAEACGFIGVRLGPRILRTETAPLAAIAIMQALWGDLSQ